MRSKRGLFESPRVPWLCMLLLLGPPAMARADALTDKARTLTSKVSHVTVFKNGTGFFIRTAQPTSAGWLVMDPPPRALQGSFWIQRGYDALIDRLRLKEGKRWESATCGSWGPLLAVNPGKKVRLELHSKAIVEGRLVPITGYDSLKGKRAGLPDFVLLDTGRGISMVPRAQIRLVHFAGKPTQTCKAVKRVPRLYLHLKKTTRNPLKIGYIQPGIEWVPLYRITLGSKRAIVEMQATVQNNVESFERATLELVIGVPNLLSERTLSPLAGTSLMPTFYGGLVRPLYQQLQLGNFHNSQIFTNLRHRNVSSHTQPFGTDKHSLLAGSGLDLGNLYVHRVGNVTIEKGARAMVQVMKLALPYKRFFVWQPGPAREKDALHRNRTIDEARMKRDRVWEYLLLQNTSQTPLTTGPAFLTLEERFLGQDLLRYTPPGGEVEIPLSVAANVLSTQTSNEISRKQRARYVNG
ncbi:MAG: hypothetical protein KC609_15305, partial [Myxococcales bacterium]|nr:hypothetical protein [Myxococcales bacterium]